MKHGVIDSEFIRNLSSPYLKLVQDEVISATDFETAVKGNRHAALEEKFLAYGATLSDIGNAKATYYDVGYFHFNADVHFKPVDLIEKLKYSLMKDAGWLPVEENGKELVVVCTEIGDQRIKNIPPQMVYPNHRITWSVSTFVEFDRYLEWLFDKAPSGQPIEIVDDGVDISDIVDSLSTDDEEEDNDLGPKVNEIEENEIVKLVNKIILDAKRKNVSDIHIEPVKRAGNKSNIRVRYRIDGSMIECATIPYKYRQAIVTRIKVEANLDISERRKPQSGKIKMRAGKQEFELRVETCSTSSGAEDVVMRILASSKPLPLEMMGFSDTNLKHLKDCITKPYGLMFVCGPTGSGKTTTLHSILGSLNTVDVKIVTAEDPVEITQDGLRQVQMNPKAGLTFANAMRSFLRQDPDIIMVGEMRDKETVTTGVEASLTGHLVLSTLHTNSAPESIIRLLDMGMDPFNFADALLGVLAQRLARTLCKDCKEEYIPDNAELKSLLIEYCDELKETSAFKKDYSQAAQAQFNQWIEKYGKGGRLRLFRAKHGGCQHCANTGYKGRVGLHELLVGTDEIKKAIQQRARPSEIAAIAIEHAGMRTLKQDGIDKVLKGVTAMSEIRKVCIK